MHDFRESTVGVSRHCRVKQVSFRSRTAEIQYAVTARPVTMAKSLIELCRVTVVTVIRVVPRILFVPETLCFRDFFCEKGRLL